MSTHLVLDGLTAVWVTEQRDTKQRGGVGVRDCHLLPPSTLASISTDSENKEKIQKSKCLYIQTSASWKSLSAYHCINYFSKKVLNLHSVPFHSRRRNIEAHTQPPSGEGPDSRE